MTDEEGRALPYSSVFTPRISYVTGDILCHQVTITEREPVMVNTRFSCLASPSAQYSFVPLWKPSFISELVPEDRCHLNGVACDEHGSPCYVTALGESNSREGWRQHAADGGVVWSVARQEAIVRGLAMPHSPCVHEGKLWLLESLSGVLVYVTPEIGAKTEVSHVGAFARGLSFAGPYAFVGLSLGRESAVAIPANSQRECGVVCIDYSRGTSLGSLTFQSEIGEIFDVCALPAHPLPYLIGFEDDMILGAFTLPSPAVFKGGLSGQ